MWLSMRKYSEPILVDTDTLPQKQIMDPNEALKLEAKEVPMEVHQVRD